MSERRLVLMEKESNPSYFDGFWMVPRPLLDDFSDAIDRFYREKWRRERKLPWPPEWGFFPWLRSSARMPWAYLPVPAVLVRQGDVLDCWRLERKEKQETIFDIAGTSWGRGPGGRLLTFRQKCEQFAEKHFHPPRRNHGIHPGGFHGASTPSTRASTRAATGSMSYLKSGMAGSCWAHASWTKTYINVPTPLNATSRCTVRFMTLEEAERACCSTRRCEAIAEDNGILCRHRRHVFELRSGMEQVRALLPSFEKVRALLPSKRMRKPDKSTGKRSADASTVRDMQPYAAARAAKATAKIDKATAKANRRMGFG
uniref:Uncharacterized protein n=1 Tax=Haptolina ericina TaxID=156174 RepID=A0A7S3EWH4_9EUKA|mmetsp:Transcript_31030/g.70092  ORF Transcript_31030/g.70092 Transcript_31030/m.70092 type:complete len:314 (+) Transcript_31030:440-1381(+)